MYKTEQLEQAVREERELRFDSFYRQDALRLARIVYELAREKGAGICCQVVLEGFEVVRFFLPGTDAGNIIWLTRKKNSVMASGWSSLRCGMEAELNDRHEPWHEDTENYVIRGGGFPIREKDGILLGALCISGLVHYDDHAMCVEALRRLAREKGAQGAGA